MAELADALDLGSSGVIRAGSSPVTCTTIKICSSQSDLNIINQKRLIFFLLILKFVSTLQNDKKYNIDGVYFLDATWDSKKSEEDKLYPYRYKYFLKTFEEILDEDKNSYYYDRLSIDVNKLSQMKASELDYSDEDDKKIIDTIGTLSNLVYTETTCFLLYLKIDPSYRNTLPISENEVEEIAQNLVSLFNKKMSAETFIRLYMSVKSLEYYINPIKTNLDIDYLYRTFLYSKWAFKDFLKKSNHKLLCDIFGTEVDPKTIFKEYIAQEKTERDISRVKLTKTLKNVINTKTMT